MGSGIEQSGDWEVLKRFVEVECRRPHGTRKGEVRTECGDLLEYARGRLEKCPYDPKPKCKECPTHCFQM